MDILGQDGPAAARSLRQTLGISQSSFSRLAQSLGDELLRVGRARSTRYARPRRIDGVTSPIPVYEVRPKGEAQNVFLLHPVMPEGFWMENLTEGRGSFHEGLPWFLQDLRPSGFIGRLVPRRHPDLDVPGDVRFWSTEHLLRYVTRHGWDLPGAFIVGDAPYATWLDQISRPGNAVDAEDRQVRYPAIANAALGFGVPGSSAAGEQPKFLATRRTNDSQQKAGEKCRLTPVLVKFSPPGEEAASRRVADLLVAEHLALETLRAHAVPTAHSVVFTGAGRTFLEVERFDRVGTRHRRGVCSLDALDCAFVGRDRSDWIGCVDALVHQRLMSSDVLPPVRLLELFGLLIGNMDMHFGNLAFYLDGVRVTGLAPVYDMLPMFYAPRHGELTETLHSLPLPSPAWGDAALPAIAAAEDFWTGVARAPDISPEFRRIGEENARRIAALRDAVRHLPV